MPNEEYMEEALQTFQEELKRKFNFDTEFFESLFDTGSPVEDVKGDYNIPGVGKLNLTFFDTSFFVDGVNYFRPFIRGFLVLMMALYNIKQVLGFIRQDAGVVTGKAIDRKG